MHKWRQPDKKERRSGTLNKSSWSPTLGKEMTNRVRRGDPVDGMEDGPSRTSVSRFDQVSEHGKVGADILGLMRMSCRRLGKGIASKACIESASVVRIIPAITRKLFKRRNTTLGWQRSSQDLYRDSLPYRDESMGCPWSVIFDHRLKVLVVTARQRRQVSIIGKSCLVFIAAIGENTGAKRAAPEERSGTRENMADKISWGSLLTGELGIDYFVHDTGRLFNRL